MSDAWTAGSLPAETPAGTPTGTPAGAPAESPARAPAETPKQPRGARWLRRGIIGVVGIIGLFGSYLLLSALLPRWWSQQVADVVAGRFTVGTFYGLFLGFTFTVLPLVALVFAARRRGRGTSWRTRIVLTAVAVVLAIPNLLTLSVVLGGGNAAHAGERIMDVEAPAFRGASLAGALIAVVITALSLMLLASRKRTRRKLSSLREQIGATSEQPAE